MHSPSGISVSVPRRNGGTLKRTAYLVGLLLMIAAVAVYASAALEHSNDSDADPVTIGVLKYELDAGTSTATVVGYDKEQSLGDLVIPASFVQDDTVYNVTSIGNDVF